MLQTYQTKLKLIPLQNHLTSEMYLDQYSQFFGELERKLFVILYFKKEPLSIVKKELCKQYNITSRQFNSIRMQLEGKVSSILEKRKLDISDLEAKISHINQFIDKKQKAKRKTPSKNLLCKTNSS